MEVKIGGFQKNILIIKGNYLEYHISDIPYDIHLHTASAQDQVTREIEKLRLKTLPDKSKAYPQYYIK